jgi:hypothetical protein
MLTEAQVCVEAVIAVAVMAMIGVISVFVAAGVTGDRTTSILVGCAMLVVSGVVLVVRLWWLTRTPHVGAGESP